MAKRIISLVSSMFLVFAIAVPAAFADVTKNTSSNYLFDYYNLYSDEDYETVDQEAADLSTTYDVGVYMLIVDDIGNQTAREFAKSFYNGDPALGMGTNRDGILFLIAVDSRDYVTITHGSAIDTFNDNEISWMEDDIVSYLSDDDFTGGVTAYYEDAEEVLSGGYSVEGDSTTSFDTDADSDSAFSDIGIDILIALVLGFIIALVICLIWKAQMKTAKLKKEADAYLDQQSFKLTQKSDQFMHSDITRVHHERNDDNDFGGGSFGGSAGGKF